MVAVWRPREGGVVVAKVLSGEESRAVGEYDVILVSETFFGGGWGRDEEDVSGAETKEEDWTVSGRNF